MKKLISIIAGLALLCLSACSFGAGNAAVQEGACSIGLPTRNADGQPIGKFNFKVVLAPQFESEVFDDLLVWAKLVKEESNESGKTIIFREIPCGTYTAAVSAESADDTSLKYAGYSEEFEIKPGENTKVSINLIKVPVSTEDDEITEPKEETPEGDEVITEPEEEEKKDDPTGGEGITDPENEKKDDPAGGDDDIKTDDDKKEEGKGDQTGGDQINGTTLIGKREGDTEVPDETNSFINVSQQLESYFLAGDAYVTSFTFSGDNTSFITTLDEAASLLKHKDSVSNPAFLNVGNGKVAFSGNLNDMFPLNLGGVTEAVYTAPFLKNGGKGLIYMDNVEFRDYNTCGQTPQESAVIYVQDGTAAIADVSFKNCSNQYKSGDLNEPVKGYHLAISGGELIIGMLSTDDPDGIRIFMDNASANDNVPFIYLTDDFTETECPLTVVLSSEPKIPPFKCDTEESVELLKECSITVKLADGTSYPGDFAELFIIHTELEGKTD